MTLNSKYNYLIFSDLFLLFCLCSNFSCFLCASEGGSETGASVIGVAVSKGCLKGSVKYSLRGNNVPKPNF
jgi:hypothetical protein